MLVETVSISLRFYKFLHIFPAQGLLDYQFLPSAHVFGAIHPNLFHDTTTVLVLRDQNL